MEYSLGRWPAFVPYKTGTCRVENQIMAIWRNDWLFPGSLRAGKRAAAVLSLAHSARLNRINRIPD